LLVSLVAMALLFATLCKFELTAKHARSQMRALRRRLAGESLDAPRGRSAAPAIPHTTAGGAGRVVAARAAGGAAL